MKTITVRYFAMFREHAGLGEETLSLDVATAKDVFEQTRLRHGSREPNGHCKVAINDEMADWSSPGRGRRYRVAVSTGCGRLA